MKEFFKDKTKLSIAFLIIIHLVGIGGMLSPYKDFFASLTPINLLVSFVVLMLNHHNLQKNWIIYLVAIYVAGFAVEVISPATKTRLFFIIVSHATLLSGSAERYASSMASEIWSHTLSGRPADNDSDVKI